MKLIKIRRKVLLRETLLWLEDLVRTHDQAGHARHALHCRIEAQRVRQDLDAVTQDLQAIA